MSRNGRDAKNPLPHPLLRANLHRVGLRRDQGVYDTNDLNPCSPSLPSLLLPLPRLNPSPNPYLRLQQTPSRPPDLDLQDPLESLLTQFLVLPISLALALIGERNPPLQPPFYRTHLCRMIVRLRGLPLE